MNSTHEQTSTSWPYVGDPSAAQLLPRPAALEYVKISGDLSGLATAIIHANDWLLVNFSERLAPLVSVDPHHANFVTLTWRQNIPTPGERTRVYAKGVVAGLLVAAGVDVI